MKISYSHLIQCIEENPSIDQLSNKLFHLGHEHEVHNDIFDIEFTPNRGDCLSVKGLLRDLAVFYTINFNNEVYDNEISKLSMGFDNYSHDICPQISFLKLEIENIPSSYKGNLESYFSDLNISKNNFFTDVSNYILYETGQPTHCYESNLMTGKLSFQEIECNSSFETLLGKKIRSLV